jgi:hypothetical protein
MLWWAWNTGQRDHSLVVTFFWALDLWSTKENLTDKDCAIGGRWRTWSWTRKPTKLAGYTDLGQEVEVKVGWEKGWTPQILQRSLLKVRDNDNCQVLCSGGEGSGRFLLTKTKLRRWAEGAAGASWARNEKGASFSIVEHRGSNWIWATVKSGPPQCVPSEHFSILLI